jgi:hypothetical protein
MFMRSISTAMLLCALLLTPLGATAADRGPSTTEERKQAIQYIQDFEADPLNPRVIEEREWVLKWLIEVPDVHVTMCVFLDKLPKGDKKDSSSIVLAQMFSQAAFVLQDHAKNSDHSAESLAGVEGALRVYEVLLKGNPKDRQPYLDDLIQQREAGTLSQFVKDHEGSACKN